MYKVAVVGIGGWGKNHLRVAAQLAGEGLVEVIYAVDIDEERLRWAERTYRAVAVRGVERAGALDVDAAVVATPTALHLSHAAVFLSRGIPTLVEKPFTATLEETYRLLDVAGRTLVTTGYLLRFHPGVRYIKSRLAHLGRFLNAYGKRTSRRPQRPGDVGVVKDLAIHDIDLVAYITGERASLVYARGGSAAGGHEDHAQIFTQHDGGSAIYEANWLTPYKFRKLELTGDRAIFAVDFVAEEVYLYGEDGIYRPRLEPAEPLLQQDREFLKAALGMGGEVVPREDVIYTMKICEAAVASIRTKRPIHIDEV
ncbi:MAG: Gfo/Idh/MocA family oxidoreductase [Pyrobaculum sp.]